MQTYLFSIIAFELIFVEWDFLNFECDFSSRMRTFNSRIRHNLSIKLVICIKAYAQSVFDIVRPFDILAVECDLKRSHIAFDTNQLTPFLPNPVTFLQVEFRRIRGRIRSYSTFSHICRILSNKVESHVGPRLKCTRAQTNWNMAHQWEKHFGNICGGTVKLQQ